MAKIEMDVSEWDIMKENKALLEKSLETEKELNKEIKRLNEEKIEILELTKKKVVSYSTKTIQEVLFAKSLNFELLSSILVESGLATQSAKEVTSYICNNYSLQNKFRDSFYTQERRVTEENTNQKLIGLHEVEDMIRKEVTSEYENQIKVANGLKEDYWLLEGEIKDAKWSEEKAKKTTEEIKKKLKEVEESHLYLTKELVQKDKDYRKLEDMCNKYKIIIRSVSDVLFNRITCFNYKEYIKKIRNILDN